MTDGTPSDSLRVSSTRRALLGRALALGASTTLLGTLLAACGGRRAASAPPPTAAVPAPSMTTQMDMHTPMSMPMPDAATPAASPASGTTAVGIQNFAFAPAALRVPVGTEITWTNEDDVPHTVTAQDKAYTSDALDTGDVYRHTFTTAGVYAYYCAIHPVMTGQIIVE
jgi:plastocyanin